MTRRAKRSGRIAVSPWPRRLGASVSASASAARARSAGPASSRPPSAWRATSSSTRSATSSSSSGGPRTADVLAEAQHPATPSGERWRTSVREDDRAVVVGSDLAEAAEVALDLPGDALGDAQLGGPLRLAELPRGAAGVLARVEIARRALEVVLGLRRVGDLAADARQAEDAQRAALVRVAQEVELAALEEQVVRVDLAGARLVALHRVVVEGDRLVAEDRGLDLGQALRRARGRRREPVMPSATGCCSGGVSGLGRPHESCCSASRSGSA